MKKSLVSLLVSTALILPACSNWNRNTPKPLDNAAMEEEVRKNLATVRHSGETGEVTLEERAEIRRNIVYSAKLAL